MSEDSLKDVPQGGFPHHWTAAILKQRPLILPRRRYVYPREAEEVERGALELLVQPSAAAEERSAQPDPFLATCALGFADPVAPTGVWSCPDPDQLCAVAGGYAYLVDTTDPERFEQVPYRPVLAVHTAIGAGLLLFVGNRAVLAYDGNGQAWESPRLSSEGVLISSVVDGRVRGMGWDLSMDKDVPFCLDLRTGATILLG